MKIPSSLEVLEPRPWVEVRIDDDEVREEIRRHGWEYDPYVRCLVLRLEFVEGMNRFSFEQVVPMEVLANQRDGGAIALVQRRQMAAIRLKYAAGYGAAG